MQRVSTMPARPVATQNSRCQSLTEVMSAAIGSPITAPTPIGALTKAIAEPRRRAGTVSRSSAMPRGMTPMPTPAARGRRSAAPRWPRVHTGRIP